MGKSGKVTKKSRRRLPSWKETEKRQCRKIQKKRRNKLYYKSGGGVRIGFAVFGEGEIFDSNKLFKTNRKETPEMDYDFQSDEELVDKA